MSACPPPHYIGRFAPTPSGPLHFGSLVCALASYLDARQHHGRWLVRIEDLDPPREQAGASSAILDTLEAHGLIWDEPVWYQSERSQAYLGALQQLAAQHQTYPCTCTRKRLEPFNGVYDGHCLQHPPEPGKPSAVRFHIGQQKIVRFDDRVQGRCEDPVAAGGDFVVHRKDGLFAYQLAVVVDDIAQGISHVVRGQDLLDSTGKQILLFQALGAPAPEFAHIPLVVDNSGQKLSKQSYAAAVENQKARSNLLAALRFMNIPDNPKLKTATIAEVLEYAQEYCHLTGFRSGTVPTAD